MPPTKTVLLNLFFAVGFPTHSTPDWGVFVARFPICNYIFTSIAENRYSHSHSTAYYSYSHTRSLHSHHYSQNRRTKRHDIGQPLISFKTSHARCARFIRFAGKSKAENRYSHPQSTAYDSKSQTRSPHSHQNSQNRRTKRHVLQLHLTEC